MTTTTSAQPTHTSATASVKPEFTISKDGNTLLKDGQPFYTSPIANEAMGCILSLLAGLLNILAFSIYNWQTFQGQTSPNITSWAIWGFMSLLNFTSYQAMSKDGWKSLLPTLSCSLCILTFILTLFQGQLGKVGWSDSIVLVVGIAASFLWWKFREHEGSMIANIMVQVGVTVGFIATFQSVWVRPQSESPTVWFIWTVSFAIQTIVVILRWKGQKRDLVYPVNCLWLHFVVGVLALR